MKKYIMTAVLLLALLIVSMGALAGCKETVAPGAAPSSVVPRVTATYDLGKASKQWRHLQMTGSLYTDNGTLTLPQDQSDTLATLAGDTFTSTTLNTATIGTGANITSPNILGTPVVSNRASGISSSLSSGNVTITHGLGSTPTRIWLTYATAPGYSTDIALFSTAIGATTFKISTTTTSVTATVYWLAYITDE